jgi:23S rRNA pseudouridine955/2504/2580 synthase
MEFTKFTITGEDADRRIDRIVRRFLPDIELSRVYQLVRKGLIRVDGKKVDPSDRSLAGQELWIANGILLNSDKNDVPQAGSGPQQTANPASVTEHNRLSVIFENEDLLFINKAASISVHGENSLEKLVPQAETAKHSLSFRTGPLHRLDKETTGILAFSRSLNGARWFSSAIEQRELEKYYLGIAEGCIPETVTWRDTEEDGKAMVTIAEPVARGLAQNNEYTLVRFRIITGRKHQIRVQSAKHGHPLAGDTRYGSERREDGSYFLHARELVFPANRIQGLPDRLFAPIPDRFARRIAALFGAESLAVLERGVVYWKHNDEHQ